MQRTLFERAGGFASVSRIVMTYYDKILASPLTSGYFTDVDMRQLIDHQTRFVATLMGGPASYTDEQLQRAHARLAITDAAFDEASALLRDALEEHGIDGEDTRAVIDAMNRRRHVIVTRNGGGR